MIEAAPNFPVYKVSGDEEIDSNPLLAHLPPEPENLKECYQRLKLNLEVKIAEREGRNSLRRRRIKQLSRFFIPADPTYSRALTTISTSFTDSYLHRNPMTKEGQAHLHGRGTANSFRPGIVLLTGNSGMGKSTLMDRVLDSIGPHVTPHKEFNGAPFPETQLLYLRRNIPPNCTPTRLARTFGTYVDKVLNVPMYGKAFARLRKKGSGQDLYLEAIDQICRTHFVGGIVLDEIQNLLGAGVQRDRVIQLLVNLREEGGMPIILVGTTKALRLLEGDFAPARRIGEGGYFELQRAQSFDDPIFHKTCEIAWEYQWLKEQGDFDEAVCKTLYDYSQGVTGVMLTLLQNGQLLALDEGKELLTPGLIERAFEERMQPLHKAIRALRSGETDDYDDLTADFWPKERQHEDPATTEDDVSTERETDLEDAEPASKVAREGKARSSPKQNKPILKISPEALRAQVMDSSSMRNIMDILKG